MKSREWEGVGDIAVLITMVLTGALVLFAVAAVVVAVLVWLAVDSNTSATMPPFVPRQFPQLTHEEKGDGDVICLVVRRSK